MITLQMASEAMVLALFGSIALSSMFYLLGELQFKEDEHERVFRMFDLGKK